MATYLLTWNPKNWDWDNLQECVDDVKEKGFHYNDWSTGVSKKIKKGDRLFLIRLGEEPRGIVGSGWAESDIFQAQHWGDPDKTANYVEICFDALVNPETNPFHVLPRQDLNSLGKMHWDSQSSGVSIPDDVAEKLEKLWAQFLEQAIGFKPVKIELKDEIEIEKTIGGGFGSAENNRRVEQAAVKKVTEWFESHGWTVKSVEAEKCGYDLLCQKGAEENHVEVKGVSGNQLSFIITQNEVKQAEKDDDFVLCVVTKALNEKPLITIYDAEGLINDFELVPLAYRAVLKK